MVKTAKMELLRSLVGQCLSAAAEEIFNMVQRTIIEYEEEMSCSKWVVDSHGRLLDVAKSNSEDSFQMSTPDVKLHSGQQHPPASVNWEKPDHTMSEPTEDCHIRNNIHPHLPPPGDQEIPINLEAEDDYVKQERDLKTPLKILKVKKPFKYPICSSGFCSKNTMVRHIKKHSEDKSSSYQCQFCDRYFYHQAEFIIHTKKHKDSKPYKCRDCDQSFNQVDSLFFHIQKHTEEKPYQCCKKTVYSETQLRSVTAATKVEEELHSKQDECGIKTVSLTITPYEKDEFDQESLQPLCLYQIRSAAEQEKDSSAPLTLDHIKTEPTGADSGTSDPNTNDQLLLSVNLGELDGGDTEPNHLSIKNILSRRPSRKSPELIVQFETGTPQKPYKCPRCSKCFSLTKTLIRHIRIHTKDKLYQCQLCGRNFCQKSDLINHTRIHTGERPYQCQECHKTFTQKGNLVVHMKKHTGKKNIPMSRMQL